MRHCDPAHAFAVAHGFVLGAPYPGALRANVKRKPAFCLLQLRLCTSLALTDSRRTLAEPMQKRHSSSLVATHTCATQQTRAPDQQAHKVRPSDSYRTELESLMSEYFEDNTVRQDYLITCATKA